MVVLKAYVVIGVVFAFLLGLATLMISISHPESVDKQDVTGWALSSLFWPVFFVIMIRVAITGSEEE